MKIAIWGTGKYYKKYISYIHEDAIEYIVDSDVKKQGTFIDNRLVQAPESIDADICDYILILVKKTEEIRDFLIGQGVERNKIIDYRSIGKLYAIEPMVHAKDAMVKLQDWHHIGTKKKILFLSHSLGRTGAPIVLLHLASLLSEKYQILFAGEGEGSLQEDLEAANIDYITNIEIFGDSMNDEFLKGFKLCFVNTITMYQWVKFFSDKNIPIVWWIHETAPQFYKGINMSGVDLKNVSCYAVSVSVQEKMTEFFPHMDVKRMPYYLPDIDRQLCVKKANRGIIKFAVLGTIDFRKAQDLLIDSVLKIEESLRERMDIIIAGTINPGEETFWEERFAQNPQIKYVGELSQQEVQHLYEEVDVLLCPSRDDPMPVVVTQAMMNAVPCVVSNKVGQAEFISHGVNGFVFSIEEPEELIDTMTWCVKNREKLGEIGNASRMIYDTCFSQDMVRANLENVIASHIGDEK